MFPCHGCLSFCRCQVISPCFIRCNNELQKLLSTTAVMCKVNKRVSHRTSFVRGSLACSVHICNSVGCVHYPRLFADVIKMSVHFNKGICMTHSHPLWTWLGIPVAAFRPHLFGHYRTQCTTSRLVSIIISVPCIHPPTGNEFNP